METKIFNGKDTILELLSEIEAIDPEMLPPPFPLEKGDRSLGFVTDVFIKKVSCFCNFTKREEKRLQIDMEALGEDPKNNPEFIKLRHKYDTVVEFQWILLRSSTNFWTGDIGIRKNWEIVEPKSSQNDGDVPAKIIKLLGL